MLDGVEFGNEVVALVRGYVEREVAPLKAANEALQARVAELEKRPAPEKGEPGEKGDDGLSPDPDAVMASVLSLSSEMIAEQVAKAVADLPPAEKGDKGDDGESIDPAIVEEMIDASVQKAVEALPKPKDGESGKDAANIVEALKDSGELVLTLQDGRLIRTGIRDGEKGKDGQDGLGFDDMDACVLDDDRTIELSFRRGEEEKAFTFKWPTAIYRSVYRDGEQYEPGDMVTWAGSLWHCNEPTKDKPGTDSWTLAAKKGRDGKDAKVG